MDIIISGVIAHVLPLEGGVSERTGKEWKRQSYVMEYEHGQYPKSVKFDVVGAKVDELAIGQGEVISAHLNITCREYNGKYYNSIECWKVDRNNGNGTQGANSNAAATVPAVPTSAPVRVNPEDHPATQMYDAAVGAGEDNNPDTLPF